MNHWLYLEFKGVEGLQGVRRQEHSVAFVTPIQADHGCNGTVTQIDAGPETFYLDDRSTQPGEMNRWLYLESNAVKGLQSGGWVDLLPESLEPELADPCAHRGEVPDTLILMFGS